MNAETPQATAPAPAAPAPSSESPGTLIRAARERAKLSLAELAGQTKLAVSTLDALERDDFAALLEPVYVRGYYRKCAKVLSIPEEKLMAAYASRVQPKPIAPPAKLRLGTGSEGGARRFGGVLMVALLAIAAGVLIWYLRGERAGLPSLPISAPATSETSAPGGEPPAVDAVAPAAETAAPAVTGEAAGYSAAPAGGGASNPPPAATAGSETTAASAAVTSPASATAAETQPAKPVASAPISTSPGSPQLLLNFVSISWARVADANGKVLLNRVVQAGERQVLEGTPPYAVFLGNAPGVQLQYQGANVDIKALIRDSATARFSVPLAPRP
ncbi:RodZ domain-containing protein [Hydrocarboniphaga sp.]|uniref:RodZ domain-containing protein n=1 Tax=Hydrocarboniphaga sp. TaxID=2033016 RepID=UPI003D0B0E72